MLSEKYAWNIAFEADAFVVPATVLQTLADGITIFRLYARLRGRLFWWDDWWALVALLLDIIYWVVFWLKRCGSAASQDIQITIIASWIASFIGPSVLW